MTRTGWPDCASTNRVSAWVLDAEANLHASQKKPYDSGASEILDKRYLVKSY